MNRRTFALYGLSALALSPAAAADEARPLDWPDLMPPGEAENHIRSRMMMLTRAPAHGSLGEDDQPLSAIQPGTFRTVAGLNGANVRLKGFVVPLDVTAGTTRTFLLVPYYGACIHAPPPPPNQTVFVTAAKPVAVKSLSRAVEVRGTLSTRSNSSPMGDAAYRLALQKLTYLD